MGKILDSLRAEFQQEATTNIFGRKVYKDEGNATLYLGARMRDAEDEKRQLEKRCAAMESAAMRILGRYDADGTAYRQWKELVEQRVRQS